MLARVPRMLQKTRIFLATLVFTSLALFFLDFAQILPQWVGELTTVQAVPALVAANVPVIAALVVLALVLGRVYCSVLCPLGVLQDVLGWLSRRFARKKKRFRYTPSRPGVRWAVVAVAVIGPFSGLTVLLSLLEPYSIFGRIATHLFRPVYIDGNNTLETLFNHFGKYWLYHVDSSPFGLAALATALASLLIVGYLAFRHGRTYCNTLCPVGTVFGLLGCQPLFGIGIDAAQCTQCGKCEAGCKGLCIDSRNFAIDSSRCVACMNCLELCPTGALRFSCRLPFIKAPEGKAKEPASPSRRTFLLGSLAVLPGLLPGVSLAGNDEPAQRQHPVLPPGAGSLARFSARCTGCHACLGKCPSRVLKPALLEYGPGGFLQPLMDYSDGFCSYDCTICTHTCPNGALRPLSLDAKHHAQLGRVVFVEELCVVRTKGAHCGACAEHCPTQAVKMIPYANGVTIPSINPDICVGCGGCEFICPVRPFRAIFVEGLAVQGRRAVIQEEKRNEAQIDSFGF